MTIFKSILLLLFWTNAYAQANQNDTSTHNKSTARKDTLKLYFPLVEEGQDIEENANSLDTFMNVWYSSMLKAMEEPILADYQSDDEVFRFTWLRTFDRPISIRIQKTGEKILLTQKMLSGAGGYDPGEIIVDTTLQLTIDVWNTVQDKIGKLKFWALQPKTEFRGFDGSEWIIEGSTSNKYHFTTRWSAGKGTAYRDFCLYLLSLSNIKIKDRDLY